VPKSCLYQSLNLGRYVFELLFELLIVFLYQIKCRVCLQHIGHLGIWFLSSKHFNSLLYLILDFSFITSFICVTAYWPSRVRVCGFWFLPIEWQFTCTQCREISVYDSSGHQFDKDNLCPRHLELQNFVKATPIFIGLSAIGRYHKQSWFSHCNCNYIYLKPHFTFLLAAWVF
jgi:hypothetical protein